MSQAADAKSVQEARQLLRQGLQFSRFAAVEGGVNEWDVNITLSSNGNDLVISAGGHANEIVNLHLITDVFVGKHSPIWAEPSLSHLEEDNCLTLTCDAKIINLSASKASDLNAFVNALQDIFNSSGFQIAAVDESKVSDPLEAGVRMRWHKEGQSQPVEVLLFYDPLMRALRWDAVTVPRLMATNSLRLSDLTDVYCGMEGTPTSPWPATKATDADLCISFAQGSSANHFEALEASTIDMLPSTLGSLLESLGTVIDTAATGQATKAEPPASVEQQSAAPPLSAPVPAPAAASDELAPAVVRKPMLPSEPCEKKAPVKAMPVLVEQQPVPAPETPAPAPAPAPAAAPVEAAPTTTPAVVQEAPASSQPPTFPYDLAVGKKLDCGIYADELPGGEAQMTTLLSSADLASHLTWGRVGAHMVRHSLAFGDDSKLQTVNGTLSFDQGLGVFWWRDAEGEESWPVEELTDVYLGKASKVFRHQAFQTVRQDQCLSLIKSENPEGALSLTAKSGVTAKLWLKVLEAALDTSGRYLSAVPAPAPSAAATAAAAAMTAAGAGEGEGEGPRRMTVSSRAAPSAAAPAAATAAAAVPPPLTRALTAEVAESTLTRGLAVTEWLRGVEGNVTSAQATLRYQNGSLWLTPPGSTTLSRDHMISLQDLSDIFVGKTSPVFRDPVCKGLKAACCVTFITRAADSALPQKEINMEFSEPSMVETVVGGIKYFLRNMGHEVEMDEAPSSATASRRFSVQAPAERRPRVLEGKVAADHLSKGIRATTYLRSAAKNNQVVGNQLVLFTQKDLLCWCPATPANPPTLTFREQHSMPLTYITDLYVGKHSPILKDAAVTGGVAECLVLKSRVCTLHLQFVSKEMRETFRNALEHLAVLRGVALAASSDTSYPAEPAPAAPTPAAVPTPAAAPTPAVPTPAAAAAAPRPTHTSTPSRSGMVGPLPAALGGSGAPAPPAGRARGPTISNSINKSGQLETAITAQDAMKTAEDGVHFSLLRSAAAAGEEPVKLAIMIKYQPTPLPLGGFAIDGLPAEHKDVPSFFQLAEMSDIWVGKQTPLLKSPFARSESWEQCLSVVLTSGVTLELVAKAPEHVVAWITAVKYIASTGGRAVELDSSMVGTAAAPSRRFSVATPPAAAAAATVAAPVAAAAAAAAAPVKGAQKEHLPNAHKPGSVLPRHTALTGRDALRALIQGDEFTMHTVEADGHTVKSSKIFVFYHHPGGKGAGMLFWNPATANRQERHTDRCVAFRQVTDIFIGPQSPVYKATAGAVGNNCLSFKTTSKELHIEAINETARLTWLNGLTYVIKHAGKRVEVDDPMNRLPATVKAMGIAPSARRVSIVAGARPKAEVKKEAVDSAVALNLIKTGVSFTAYERSPLGGISSRSIFVFYRAEPPNTSGCLFWCEAAHGASTQTHALPLSETRSIMLGKQTKLLAEDELKHIDVNLCLTIASKSGALNLQSDAPEIVIQVIAALKHVFEQSGRGVQLESKLDSAGRVDQRRRDSILSQVPTLTSKSKKADPRLAQALGNLSVQALSAGSLVTIYKNGTPATKEEVFLYLEPEDGKYGAFYWCDPSEVKGSERAHWPSCRIGLDELNEVVTGKHAAVFKLSVASEADARCCFSLVSSLANLHVETSSREARITWVNGLSALLAQFGKKLIDSEETKEEDVTSSLTLTPAEPQNRRLSVMPLQRPTALPANPAETMDKLASKRSAFAGVSARDVLVCMHDGQLFHWFCEIEPGMYVRKAVWLFWVGSQSQPGTLYWSEKTSGEKERRADQSLALTDVSEVLLSKQSPGLNSNAAAISPPENCVSIVTKRGKYLELEARSPDVLSAWLFGIDHILTHIARRKIVDLNESSSSATVPRTPNPSMAAASTTPSKGGKQRAPRRFSVTMGTSSDA